MTHADATNHILLSVAILTRDEENVIADTIRSVVPIADEIVVIDTGSTDRTVAIARRAGARVIEIAWNDDFSAARNAAWEHLAGEWVLWVDADEQLTAESARGIRRSLEQQPENVAALVVMVAVPPASNSDIGEEVGQIRLVRQSANVRFEGRVAESLKPALNRAELGIMLSEIRLERSMREHDPEIKAHRAARTLRLIQLEMSEHGESPRLLLAAGEIQSTCGDRDNAIALFRKTIDTAEAGSTEMLSAFYGLLTALGEDPQAHEQLLAAGLEALEVFPLDSHLLCLMGSHLETQNRHDTAVQSFRVAHQYGQIDPFTWHVREIGEIVAVCLATSLETAGHDDEAIAVLDEASQRFDGSPRILRRLLELRIKHANHEEALAVVDRMRLSPDEQGALRSAVRGGCLAVQENWIPALAQLRAAHEAGCRDAICLRWYSVTLLANGKAEEAEHVLVQWQEVEPDNEAIEKYLTSLHSAIKIGNDAHNEYNAHVRVSVPSLDLLADAPRTAPPSGTLAAPTPAMPTAPSGRALALFKQAVALVERSEWESALARFGEARAAGYQGAEIYAPLARCLAAVGRTDEARLVLREWLELDPASEAARQALAELPGQSESPLGTPSSQSSSMPHSQPARPHMPGLGGAPASTSYAGPSTDPANV